MKLLLLFIHILMMKDASYLDDLQGDHDGLI